jgi:hypothetical protein
MRILIYGLQSSGASYFTYLLGQNPNSAVILDLFNKCLMPELAEVNDEKDLIGKCVITTKYAIQDHQKSFQPDRTILFLRHPFHNYQSLINKTYAHQNGTVQQKFEVLEHLFKDNANYFDLIVHYEDIFFRPNALSTKLNKHQIPFKKWYFNGHRSLDNIVNHTKAQSKWLTDNFNFTWGCGNLNFKGDLKRSVFKEIKPFTRKMVKKHTPEVLKHYKRYKPELKTKYYLLRYQSWSHNKRLRIHYFKRNLKCFLFKST